MLAKKRCLVI